MSGECSDLLSCARASSETFAPPGEVLLASRLSGEQQATCDAARRALATFSCFVLADAPLSGKGRVLASLASSFHPPGTTPAHRGVIWVCASRRAATRAAREAAEEGASLAVQALSYRHLLSGNLGLHAPSLLILDDCEAWPKSHGERSLLRSFVRQADAVVFSGAFLLSSRPVRALVAERAAASAAIEEGSWATHSRRHEVQLLALALAAAGVYSCRAGPRAPPVQVVRVRLGDADRKDWVSPAERQSSGRACAHETEAKVRAVLPQWERDLQAGRGVVVSASPHRGCLRRAAKVCGDVLGHGTTILLVSGPRAESALRRFRLGGRVLAFATHLRVAESDWGGGWFQHYLLDLPRRPDVWVRLAHGRDIEPRRLVTLGLFGEHAAAHRLNQAVRRMSAAQAGDCDSTLRAFAEEVLCSGTVAALRLFIFIRALSEKYEQEAAAASRPPRDERPVLCPLDALRHYVRASALEHRRPQFASTFLELSLRIEPALATWAGHPSRNRREGRAPAFVGKELLAHLPPELWEAVLSYLDGMPLDASELLRQVGPRRLLEGGSKAAFLSAASKLPLLVQEQLRSALPMARRLSTAFSGPKCPTARVIEVQQLVLEGAPSRDFKPVVEMLARTPRDIILRIRAQSLLASASGDDALRRRHIVFEETSRRRVALLALSQAHEPSGRGPVVYGRDTTTGERFAGCFLTFFPDAQLGEIDRLPGALPCRSVYSQSPQSSGDGESSSAREQGTVRAG